MLGTDVLEPHILPYNQILHEQVIATPEGASAKSEEGIRLVKQQIRQRCALWPGHNSRQCASLKLAAASQQKGR